MHTFSNILNAVKLELSKEETMIKKLSRAIIIIPFMICVLFLNTLGKVLRLNYKEISVIFNIYIQAGFLLLVSAMPFIMQLYCTVKHFNTTNLILLIFFLVHLAIYTLGFKLIIRHYSLPLESTFDLCVNDLLKLSSNLGISYWSLNILLFIILYLLLIGTNIAFLYLSFLIGMH